MIHKISDKNQSTPLKHLIKNNTRVTDIKDIANTLAHPSQQILPLQTPTQNFTNTKTRKKNKSLILNFSCYAIKPNKTKSYKFIIYV